MKAKADEGTPESAFVNWLETEDRATRVERAQRLRTLHREYGGGGGLFLPGGEVSVRLFEEARSSYLNGQYIGCLVLTTAFISTTLAGLYRMEPSDEDAESDFGRLLRAARRDAYISVSEYMLFNKVRKLRNFYVHPPSLMARRNVMTRVVREKAYLETLSARDARTALRAMFRLLRRQPFTWSAP